MSRQGHGEWLCSMSIAQRGLAKEMSRMGPETLPHTPLAKSSTLVRSCVCLEQRTDSSDLSAQKDTFF